MSGISILAAGRPSAEMDIIWSDESFLKAACKVELAWVEAAADKGLQSRDAAVELEGHIAAVVADPTDVFQQAEQVGRPIVPLVDALAADASPELLRVLHLGLTTQDIVDSALQLLRGQAVWVIDQKLRQTIKAIDLMAEKHRRTPMLARTNGQIAAITTLGLFLAEAAAELHRGMTRLALKQERDCPVCLNGAIGISTPFGEQSDAVRHGAGDLLELTYDPVVTAVPRDRIADLHCSLAVIAKSTGRIARTIKALQAEAIGELSELRAGVSSAMPHKTNPRLAEKVIVLSDQIDAHLVTALNATQTLHHRSGESWMQEWAATQYLFLTLDAQLVAFQRMIDCLVVEEATMRRHIKDAGVRAVSDRLFCVLSYSVGRTVAKQLMAEVLSEGVQLKKLPSFFASRNPDLYSTSIEAAISIDEIIGVAASKQREIEARRTTHT